MGKYLILGALASAAIKTLLPTSVLDVFAANLFLSVVGMMLLAIGLSICSEADAFVAASFSVFPAAAQLAFVAIGPMLDLKLAAMFAAVFARRALWTLLLLPATVVLAACLLLGAVWGGIGP